MSDEEQGCYTAALESLRQFSEDELRQFAKKVFSRAKEIDPGVNMNALEEARLQIYRESLEDKMNDAQRLANSAIKIKNAVTDIKNGLTLTSSLSRRGVAKMDKALSSMIDFERDQLQNSLFRPMSTEELSHLHDKRNDLEIGQAFDGKEDVSSLSKSVAEKIRNYFAIRNAGLFDSDAMGAEELRDDRFVKTIHNSDKVAKQSLDQFNKTILPLVNIEKSFPSAVDEEGNVDQKRINDIQNKIYANILNPDSNAATTSSVVNDANELKKLGKRTYVFDKFENQIRYNQINGEGALFEMLSKDINSAARKTGIARKLGANADYAFNKMREAETQSGRKHAPGYIGAAELMFKQLKGSDLTVISPKIANVAANIRSITSMARLGSVFIQSTPDIGFMMSNATRFGGNPFKAFGTHAFALLDNRFANNTPEYKYMAEKLKFLFDPHLGYMGRFLENENGSELLHKTSNWFFRFNGLHSYDMGNKVAASQVLGNVLYDARNTEYGKLKLATKNWIDKFMTPDEWEALRNKGQVKGIKVFNVDAPDHLSDDEINELWKKSDRQSPKGYYRTELARKLHSMFVTTTERTVLNPTEFEGVITAKFNKGTYGREIIQAFTQFKQFALGTMDRVFYQGLKDAKQNGNIPLWATAYLAGTIPLAIASNMISERLLGYKAPFPDFSNMSGNELIKAIIDYAAPSFALFSGVFDPRHQDSNAGTNLLSSPTSRFISEGILDVGASTLSLGADTLLGKDKSTSIKGIKKGAMSAATYMLPLQNTPILTPILHDSWDYMTGNPPASPFITGGTREPRGH